MSPKRIKNQKTDDLIESTVVEREFHGENVEGSSASKNVTSSSRKTRKAALNLRKGRGTSAGTRKSKRQRIEEAPQVPIVYSKEGDCMGRDNTSGLAILPPELLSEIISYLPQLQVPFQHNLVQPLCEDESGLERLSFLRALSQTCRSLRSFALPLCWEIIEAVSCDSETVKYDSRWGKALATDLIRQLEIVTVRDPSLAQYVKVVTVLMTPWCINGVVKELARCLALFPNLHTLQILGITSPEYQTKFRAFFSKVKLLGVRTLAVSVPAAIPVINACPGVVKIIPFRTYTGLHSNKHPYNFRIEDMTSSPCLEQLGHVQLQSLDVLRHAIQKFPRLKIIDLVARPYWSSNLDNLADCLNLMRQLENLHCIRIHAGWIGSTGASISSQILVTAKAVLQNSPHPAPGSHKCLVQVLDGKPEHCLILGQEFPGKSCPYVLENGTPTHLFMQPRLV